MVKSMRFLSIQLGYPYLKKGRKASTRIKAAEIAGGLKKKLKRHRAQLRFIYVIIESQLNEQREEVDLVGTVPLTKLNTERISISNSKSMQ